MDYSGIAEIIKALIWPYVFITLIRYFFKTMLSWHMLMKLKMAQDLRLAIMKKEGDDNGEEE